MVHRKRQHEPERCSSRGLLIKVKPISRPGGTKSEKCIRGGIMIREVIENSDLSWSEIAKIYGIPQKTMEKWYYGTREPPEYVSRLLERALREDGRISG